MVRHRHSSGGERRPGATGAPPPDRAGPPATSPPARRARTVRGRLIWILALPMLAVVVLLGVVVIGDLGNYRTARATTGSVVLALGVQDLVQELEQERGLASGLLGGDVGFRADLDAQRVRVDRERDFVARLAAGGAQGSAAVRTALGQLDALAGTRAQIDAGKGVRSTVFQFFTDRIASFNNVDFGLDRSADGTLRRGVASLEAMSEIKEYLSQERAVLNGVFAAGGFGKGEYAQFVAVYAALHEAETQFGRTATATQVARAIAVQSSGAYSEALDFESRALAAADGRPLQVDPQSWWSALTTVLDKIRELQQLIGADIRLRAGNLQTDASRRLALLGALVLLCVAGAVALMVAAARSITGPLAALAAEADAVASRRLPEAVAAVQSGTEADQPEPPPPVRVPERASSEIYSVAEALNRVQATAYTLATEQALLRRNTTESLANLGRRNQSLLRRQLGFITRLEREESDPSGLANLFELDHLATRMRRNAESLLVLVGAGSPRAWDAPMPVADVIRAAVSEVEEYRRVTLRRIDDAYVAGAYVTGVAHMVAELVENGLTFSPPDVDVELQGRLIGNQYLIAITDQGVGMEPEEMARANARLRGEEHFLMAPARFLGHYVVGQLARQMGVEVVLSPSPVTGVTARVTLPERVLATAPALPGDRPAAVPVSVVEPRRGVPPAPAPVAAQLAIGVRPAPVVEYVTVPDAPAPGPDPGGPGTPAGPAPSIQEADRTRNGLRKRPPRVRVPAATAPPGSAAPGSAAGGAPRPAAVDDSPAQLRQRLVSLRAGVQRSEYERSREQPREGR